MGRRRATRPAPRAGLTTRRPARPRVLGEVVPGRLGLGDARADPALVLLAALHVGRARRPRAVQARARLREDARRARPRDARLVGEHDRGRGRVRADGRRRDALAVLRAAARPQPALRLRARRTRSSASCSRSGTRSSSSSTTRTSRASRRRSPTSRPARRPSAPLDRWLVARTNAARRRGDRRVRGDADRRRRSARSRRSSTTSRTGTSAARAGASTSYDEAAFRTLWYALVQSLRVVAPVMPFLDRAPLAEPRAGRAGVGAPRAAGRRPAEPDRALLAEIAEVRRVVELGRQARSTSRLKLRQPLRRLVVAGRRRSRAAHADEIADELRVKEVEFGDGRGVGAAREAEPAGARAEARRGAARRARARSQRGEFEELDGGRFQVDGHELEPDEVLVERVGLEGWAVASEDGVTVALDTALDDELRLEGRVLDLIHEVNVLRKETRPRDHRPDPALDPRRGAARALRATGSPPRRSPSRSSPASCGSRRREMRARPSLARARRGRGGLRRRAARRRRRTTRGAFASEGRAT